MSTPNVKILVCYHKPATLIKNEIFVPIHVGRAKSYSGKTGQSQTPDIQWLLGNTIGDDTGDNISSQNNQYAELTALYWAWKNYDQLGNPDYIGLMHYRRILIFHPEEESKPNSNMDVDYITDKIIQKYTAPDYVLRDIEKYDIYLYAQFFHSRARESEGEERRRVRGYQVECSLQYLKEYYPEIYEDAEEYFARPYGNRCNIIVCRREIFFEYCEFLFNVLDGLKKALDFSRYCAYDYRAFGFISEWLLGIWAYSKARSKGYKVKETTFIKSRDALPYNLQDSIQPAFAERNIPIFCACDDNYAYPCSVMLQSVIEHASADYNYDLVVLNNGLSAESVEMLRSLLPPPSTNFSLRFYSMTKLMSDKKFSKQSYITPTSYCKLFALTIFANYKKVVYLDVDTLATDDIGKLYHTDIGENWIAGARDYNQLTIIAKRNLLRERYSIEELGIDDALYQYFSSGVLVFNIEKLKTEEIEEKWVQAAQNEPYKQMDQDVLNMCCKGHVYYLDTAWNVMHNAGARKNNMWRLPVADYKKYSTQDRKHPKLIHYAGPDKPWMDATVDMSELWWEYARKSPIYEKLIYKYINAFSAQTAKKAVTELAKQHDAKLLETDKVQAALSSGLKELKQLSIASAKTQEESKKKIDQLAKESIKSCSDRNALLKQINSLETKLAKADKEQRSLENMLKLVMNYKRYRRKYFLYRLGCHFTFGKFRKHCREQKWAIRKLLTKIQNFQLH